MNATSVAGADAAVREGLSRGRVPLWLNVIYTAFMAVLGTMYRSNLAYVPTDWALRKIRPEKVSS